MKLIDLTDQQFGEWLVKGRATNEGHKNTVWTCQCSCGVIRAVLAESLRHGLSKSCGHAAYRGVNNKRWKGGRFLRGGYVLLLRDDHPHCDSAGYVREHIIVMEQKLGRYLLPGENIHHRNGVRDDNRPENLELWCKPQPSGIRVEDAVVWAKEVLARYDT